MIARIWKGATETLDARAYVDYLLRTGIDDYLRTRGNRGAWVLWREHGGRAEFLTLSMWDSLEAIGRFAGEDVSRALFYPEDDRYLVERDETVSHYEVEVPAAPHGHTPCQHLLPSRTNERDDAPES